MDNISKYMPDKAMELGRIMWAEGMDREEKILDQLGSLLPDLLASGLLDLSPAHSPLPDITL